jgi:hypothetical protein
LGSRTILALFGLVWPYLALFGFGQRFPNKHLSQ